MRRYLCTVMHKGEPVVIDGQTWQKEVTAENISKARYSFWLIVQTVQARLVMAA